MEDDQTLSVGVVHCDLRQANYPIAVGHYLGDVIVHAEAVLDATLGGALRRRFDLGLYPGKIGTSEIFRHGVHPPGAIVIGLGPVGELTPERLRVAFAMALRRYALRVAESGKDADGCRSAAFSTLLVGTDGGAFGGIADSIYAIIRGAVDANRSLTETGLANRVRIDRIEFVELYEDVAIRAAHVVDELPGPLAQELKPGEKIKGARRLDTRPGGRFLRPADPYASGWWQRIAVRRNAAQGTAAAVPSDTTTALQFTVLTDRARLEQTVAVAQRTLVQQLLTSATSRPDNDLALSAALYQLLVPSSVKDRIGRGGDLLFMVDRAGAAYPYELMAERTSDGMRPLAETRGILRQFETEEYRVQPEMARADRIFIVGNPKTILWADLPGAFQEAEEVAAIAEAKALSVHRAPREDAERTLVELMTNEYRILHFAAHGQFDPDPMKSGVVIGDRLFVTPAEVERLPAIPELVFLNCCYLGTMGEPRAAGPDPRLAASLAEGFIRAGVRAVVAAGWAVQDAAGRTFARTFYEHFLEGATFGEAVRLARKMTRGEPHEQFNTWGAYQCYGNPDYRFRRSNGQQRKDSATSVVARSEALQALRTLASSARSMQIDDVVRLRHEFQGLFTTISAGAEDGSGSDWPRDGEVLSLCGEICGELGDFDRAIGFYKKALETVPATASFATAEQLTNLLSRSPLPRALDDEASKKAGQRFREALEWLDWLDHRLAPSKERWALRGALHKRWSIFDPVDRRPHLKKSAAAYAKGAALAGRDGYQRLNTLALDFVLGSAAARKRLQSKVDGYVEEALRPMDKVDRTFWDLVELPDTLLHKHIVYGTLAGGSVVQEVIDGYGRARAVGPSLRQWGSVQDHVWFLAAMLADSTLRCCDAETAAAVSKVLLSLGPSLSELASAEGAAV
jgi:CHAT domain-containing protein